VFVLNFFYVFDTDNDLSRARLLTAIDDGSASPAPAIVDYDVMEDHSDGDVRSWIDAQLATTSCLVVLIGEHTSEKHWVKYAIGMARQLEKPMIGVAIDKLIDGDGRQGAIGSNPFASAGMTARALSSLEIYDPPFATSAFARAHIRYGLPDWVELAVKEQLWKSDSRTRRFDRREQTRHEDAS
jgi:hypothetical protein